MTVVWDTEGAEASVWDTAGTLVWGSGAPGPEPQPGWPFPTTEDSLVLQARPAAWAVVYEVAADGSQDYTSISAALDAEQGRRSAAQIQGVGPQDYAIVRVHPGVYEEKIRSFPQWALVGVTGERDDVLITADMDATDNPVLSATQSMYVESVTFTATYSETAVPPPGDTRAVVWNSNAGPDTTIVFVNVRTDSRNAVLNSCAMQPGHRNTYLFYRSRFETHGLPSQTGHSNGFQPFNVQTGLDVRYPNRADLGSDVICIDCEAVTDSDELVTGVSDLGSGTSDRIAWIGGDITFDPSWQVAQYFHSKYHSSTHKDYRAHSWVTPEVAFAGEAVEGVDLHWQEPPDLEAWLPSGAVGPKARDYFYPQALDTTGELPTGTPSGAFTMQPGRWYYIPVATTEARTLAGFSLDVTSYTGTGGKLHAALWDCPPNVDEPKRWRSFGSSSPIAEGTVTVHRGTYRNVRLYPGALLWVGVMADQECVVSAAVQERAFYQDAPAAPAAPTATAIPAGLVPAPVVRTGIV